MAKTRYSRCFQFALIFFILLLGIVSNISTAQAQDNQIIFDNQSGQNALVKVIGPTSQQIKVPNSDKGTVNVLAGEYYVLVRYGNKPDQYTFSKGDPFTVTQTETQYSVITITLHKVAGGNYSNEPISEEEFNRR